MASGADGKLLTPMKEGGIPVDSQKDGMWRDDSRVVTVDGAGSDYVATNPGM